jgi:lysine N6-hydroxylase
MTTTQTHYDFIGVGIGPFNLSLAALTQPLNEKRGMFFDNQSDFDWHPGMMLESATLQTPFLADLVTLADPTHPLSFLNYAKKTGRLYSFYIRENFFLMRKEYNQYCQWACRQLNNIQFNTQVERIDYDKLNSCYIITLRNTQTNEVSLCSANKIILGTGPKPFLPDACADVKNKVTHSSVYLMDKKKLQQKPSITIVGSGQSAAEIFYDLLSEIDHYHYELNWVTRSPRFFPLEYSKLTLEMTSPEYVDYFYNLPQSQRDQLITNQKHLYKGINSELINAIFDLLYIKQLSRQHKIQLITNSQLNHCSLDTVTEQFLLEFEQLEQKRCFRCKTDSLIMASGYYYQEPDCIRPVSHRIARDEQGRFKVARNYAIDHQNSEIFVQNAELHTHGFVAPDLGMGCYRNSILIRELYGREIYPIEKRIAFQTFDAGQLPASSFEIIELTQRHQSQTNHAQSMKVVNAL